MFVAGSRVTRTWQDRFPIRAHSSGHYWLDNYGNPFPVLGRMSGLVFSMSSANYTVYLNDTQNKGFTTIWVKTPQCPIGYPADGSGNLSFLKNLGGGDWNGYTGEQGATYTLNTPANAPDFTTPNPAFFSNFDTFLTECEKRGFLVIWFPCYVGFHDTDWWMNVMVANGATKMQTYGAWLVNRYQNQRNLIWGLGGDKGVTFNTFSSNENAVLAGFHTGLKSRPTRSTFFGAEWDRGTISKDLYASESNCNFCYSAATDINNQGARGWATSPAIPACFIEYPVETTGGSEGIMRRFMFWALLSTLGYNYGHGTVTDFVPGTYEQYLNTQGALDAERCNKLWQTLPWQKLVPANSVITAGGGTANTDDQAVAARASDGSLIVLYRPPTNTNTITVDMTQMSGSTLIRRWDPTNATFTTEASGVAATGTRNLTHPGNNAAGANNGDWLYLLTA